MLKDNLKPLREKAGYSSAKEFAKVLGIPYSSYTGYETKGTWPTQDLLFRIATALHVSIDELLGYELDRFDNYKQTAIKNGFSVSAVHELGGAQYVYITFTDSIDAKELETIYGNELFRDDYNERTNKHRFAATIPVFMDWVANSLADYEQQTTGILRRTMELRLTSLRLARHNELHKK